MAESSELRDPYIELIDALLESRAPARAAVDRIYSPLVLNAGDDREVRSNLEAAFARLEAAYKTAESAAHRVPAALRNFAASCLFRARAIVDAQGRLPPGPSGLRRSRLRLAEFLQVRVGDVELVDGDYVSARTLELEHLRAERLALHRTPQELHDDPRNVHRLSGDGIKKRLVNRGVEPIARKRAKNGKSADAYLITEVIASGVLSEPRRPSGKGRDSSEAPP